VQLAVCNSIQAYHRGSFAKKSQPIPMPMVVASSWFSCCSTLLRFRSDFPQIRIPDPDLHFVRQRAVKCDDAYWVPVGGW
jgi:hypothetical protein